MTRREDTRPPCARCQSWHADAHVELRGEPSVALCTSCLIRERPNVTRVRRVFSKRCDYRWERRTPGKRYVNARGQCKRWTAHPSGYCSEHRGNWRSETSLASVLAKIVAEGR